MRRSTIPPWVHFLSRVFCISTCRRRSRDTLTSAPCHVLSILIDYRCPSARWPATMREHGLTPSSHDAEYHHTDDNVSHCVKVEEANGERGGRHHRNQHCRYPCPLK